MPKFTFKTFQKNFTLETQKWANKITVRELDEEPKGTFVAFVDDGDESFDVSFRLSKTDEITDLNCDCKNGRLNCAHKFALLNFVAKDQKVKHIKIVKKKLTESGQLLQDLDQNQLIEWLAKILKTNKTLETEFLLEFKYKAKDDYTDAEIYSLTNLAITTVVGKRKKLEKSELKSIVDLWSKFHDPIFQLFKNNPQKLDLILILEASMMEFIAASNCKSFNDFDKYSNRLNFLIVETIKNLENESVFSSSIQKLIDKIIYKNEGYQTRFLEIIDSLFYNATENRKKIIAKIFLTLFEKDYSKTDRQSNHLAEPLLKYLIDSELFITYFNKVKPVTYGNNHNLLLIEKLIEINESKLAEKYAFAQITNNIHAEYNVPYYRILKRIYESTNNNAGLLQLSEQLLPITFDISDYRKVLETMPDDEAQKKFRSDMIVKAKKKADKGDQNAMKFCVNLAIEENKVSSIFAYLSKYKKLGLYMGCLEQLIKSETSETLRILLVCYTDFSWSMNASDIQKEVNYYPEILRIIKQNVDVKTLQIVQKRYTRDSRWASKNSLHSYLMKHLFD